MLRGLRTYRPLPEIAAALHTGDAIFGTDGSAANDHGTYAFVLLINIDEPEPTLAVRLGGNMPDIAEYLDMDSHRPEAAALYAALVFTRKILDDFPPPPNTTNACTPLRS